MRVAGTVSKAERGELALSLPAGLVRLESGFTKDVQRHRCVEHDSRSAF
jgi:hypothetical protein